MENCTSPSPPLWLLSDFGFSPLSFGSRPSDFGFPTVLAQTSFFATRAPLCYKLLTDAMNGFALRWISLAFQGLGQVALLARDVIGAVFLGKTRGRDLTYQLYFIGAKSQSVV